MRYSDAMREFCMLILKLLFVWPFGLIRKLFNNSRDERCDNYRDYDRPAPEQVVAPPKKQSEPVKKPEVKVAEDITPQKPKGKYDDLPEIPEMCQIFPLDENTCIGVQFVDMCPDETAHIRVIGDTTFSQIYKRRVYREKTYQKRRYFMLNGERYFLRPDTTQPIDPVQAKEGK